MKHVTRNLLVLTALSILLTSCATICGGSKYYAHVNVMSHPNAEVVYQGVTMGRGGATMLIKRTHSDKLSFTVREKGCTEQDFNYRSRTFRGWALVGTLITWGYYGAGIDLISGAFWKPNAKEPGVVKSNYKNFQYIVNYTGCASRKEEVMSPGSEQDKLVDVVYLKNGSIIRGTLIDQDPTTQVKIQTKDGSIFVFKIDEILKVTRE